MRLVCPLLPYENPGRVTQLQTRQARSHPEQQPACPAFLHKAQCDSAPVASCEPARLHETAATRRPSRQLVPIQSPAETERAPWIILFVGRGDRRHGDCG